MDRSWPVLGAALVALVAGVLAVVTAHEVVAVVAGVASAVTGVVVLAQRPRPAPSTPPTAAAGPEPARDLDAEPDPLQALFEAGPAADGSGLLAADFVVTTLRGRVAVARRALRPLSVVCFEAYETERGEPTEPVAGDEVARVLSRTLRDADVAGWASAAAFVCILEDTGDDGAVWTAERIRRNLAEGGLHRRFRAGVASYPTHALEAEELEAKAQGALQAARDWTTDRIEVATAS